MPLWKLKGRTDSVGTDSPVRADRSLASRSASASSAHTSTTGAPVSRPRAAARQARWMADRPDSAAGQRPLSMTASSSRSKGAWAKAWSRGSMKSASSQK